MIFLPRLTPSQTSDHGKKNCCFKPKYILKKLLDLQAPVLWIDADAIIYQKPTLFENLEADVAVRIVEEVPNDHPSKIISGTLFFNHTPEAIQVLQEWDEETEKTFANRSRALGSSLPQKRSSSFACIHISSR